MGTALLKLGLSLLAGGIGYHQHLAHKPDATVFCLLISLFLFIGFVMDLIRLSRQEEAPKSRETPAAPAAADYPDAPDPGDLRIGKIYRASDVNQYEKNILTLAKENPDYALSESEIIDNYLTDKKLWKYDFRPQKVTVEPGPSEVSPLRVMTEGLQIGAIRTIDSVRLWKAMKGKGIEVVYCTIGGGPYKTVQEDEVSGRYQVKSGETGYSVTLSICEKQ